MLSDDASHRAVKAGYDQAAGRPSPCHLGVPYNHVSVRVFGYSAFLRVEVEDFCCVAARDSHKSILVHFAAVLTGGNDTRAADFRETDETNTALHFKANFKVDLNHKCATDVRLCGN